MKAKKILKGIGIFFLILLLLVGIFFAVCKIYGNKNTFIMNGTINDGLNQVKKHYNVSQLDAGEFENLRFYGIMNFHTDQYKVENLGNLSVMTADMGFMQMVSFMIVPFEKNVPMCTLDFMYIFGKRKSYVEFYDLVGDTQTDEYKNVVKQLSDMAAKYDDVKEIEVKENWYDKYLSVIMHKEFSGDNIDERNDRLFQDALSAYLNAADALPVSSEEDQKKQLDNTQEYCNGLIEKGGVSTDVFKKALGADKTHEFFDNVFFGTNRYKK